MRPFAWHQGGLRTRSSGRRTTETNMPKKEAPSTMILRACPEWQKCAFASCVEGEGVLHRIPYNLYGSWVRNLYSISQLYLAGFSIENDSLKVINNPACVAVRAVHELRNAKVQKLLNRLVLSLVNENDRRNNSRICSSEGRKN